ncbi:MULTISPECIES: fibronectin type III-like domain-contianing protein, partial [Bacteroides]
SRDVKFVITEDDLKFYNPELDYVYEPGEFDVMVGTNSRDVQIKHFKAD